jgi:hypothetical protein
MVDTRHRASDGARIALACVRLVMGGLGLVAPTVLVRRLGVDPAGNTVALYAFRLFGVRNVVLGVALLGPAGPVRDHAVRTAPIIHASDTLAAAVTGIRGPLPRRAAIMIVLISLVNTVLAILASAPRAGDG